jgi:hypothetical protein
MGLIYDMSSQEYHSKAGTYSSSQLKYLLEDPEIFYKKYVTKEIEREENPVFDVGTYFHTSILEPEKIKTECTVFEGIRRGKEWEKFKEDNKGKAIITKTELEQATNLTAAVKNSPIAMGRLERGSPEVSAFEELFISRGEIFSTCGMLLGRYGWEDTKLKPGKDQIPLTLKVRADLLAETFILDLKSTTGNTKNEFNMRASISKYQYDLSAALYLDIFTLATGKVISEFIWTFASKDVGNSKSYMATDENIQVGRAKYKKALLKLADCIAEDWKFEDTLGTLAPNIWELEYIKPKGADLL